MVTIITITNSVAPEPEGSSLHSQEPTNSPYPEPGKSTSHTHTHSQQIFQRSILIPSSPLCLGLLSDLIPLGFPTKTLYMFLPSPMCVTCPTHLILLDFMCLIMSGEDYKLWIFPLCNFLLCLITSSLLGTTVTMVAWSLPTQLFWRAGKHVVFDAQYLLLSSFNQNWNAVTNLSKTSHYQIPW
jgi:hypothetical protein